MMRPSSFTLYTSHYPFSRPDTGHLTPCSSQKPAQIRICRAGQFLFIAAKIYPAVAEHQEIRRDHGISRVHLPTGDQSLFFSGEEIVGKGKGILKSVGNHYGTDVLNVAELGDKHVDSV